MLAVNAELPMSTVISLLGLSPGTGLCHLGGQTKNHKHYSKEEIAAVKSK